RASQVSAAVPQTTAKKSAAKKSAAAKAKLAAVADEPAESKPGRKPAAKKAAKKSTAKKTAKKASAKAGGDDVELDDDADLAGEDLSADLLVEVDGDDVVLTVGKKRSADDKQRALDEVDESTFEPTQEADLEKELVEDEGFSLSDAD